MRKPTVFVVDDEEQICDLLTRILVRDGCMVRSFQDPTQALEVGRREPPDVLLTDLMMPGISGMDLIRRLRGRHPDMGAIMMTGFASIENVVDALRNDVDDFVPKPFSVSEIRAVVSRVLQARRAGPPAPLEETVEADPQAVEAARKASGQGSDHLARKFRDMSVAEQIHGLLAEDVTIANLVPRASTTLAGALVVTHAVLLAPAARPGSFHADSSTIPARAWSPRGGWELHDLALVAQSGLASRVARESVRPCSALLDAGPLAAAPTSPRSPEAADRCVLVVSRPSGARPFDDSALRLLSVAAKALGDVYRALRGPARTEKAYVDSLGGVVASTENRNPWFRSHSDRVRDLSVRLGRRVGLDHESLEVLGIAARLLDLGRVEMPDQLLGKVEPPSRSDWDTIRLHPLIADDLIRPVGMLKQVKPIVRHHHENWDGTGYPDGLKGEEIPLLASLVHVADAYTALTSARAWRPAFPPERAVRELLDQSGRQFHPQLVAAFADLVADEGADIRA